MALQDIQELYAQAQGHIILCKIPLITEHCAD